MIVAATVMSLASAEGVTAQWTYRNPNVPRTKDGKPDLNSSVPRTAWGTVDLSGVGRLISEVTTQISPPI